MLSVIPINHQTWLVCGGRDFTNQQMFDAAMSDLVHQLGMPEKIVHGGARGADQMAGGWAGHHAIDIFVEHADWQTHGRSAGPMRNQKMIDAHKPDYVIAFPGGRGTADMISRAKAAHIDVIEVRPK